MVARRQVLSCFSTAVLHWHLNQSQRTVSDSIHDRPLLSVPRPKFWFGQQVCWEWTSNDDLDPNYGKTYRDLGQVVGMVWQPPHYKDVGWVYWVKWVEVASPTVSLPFVDEAPEEDLSLFNNQ